MATWHAPAIILLAVACAAAPREPSTIGSAEVEDATPGTPLRIASSVDTLDESSQLSISCLRKFFSQKLLHEGVGDFWDAADSIRYGHIFNELRYAEYDSVGDFRYPPTLVEVLTVAQPGDRMLKVNWAAVGPDGSTQAPRYVFNFLARNTDEGPRLSFPVEENTRSWERRTIGPLYCIISPRHAFTVSEAERDVIGRLGSFFDVEPMPITYYAFADAEDLYRSCGFDAHPLLHEITTGGMVDAAGRVYAGRSHGLYLHELVHVFADRRQSAINGLFGEGIAMLIGGSGDHDYAWHRANMKRYLEAGPVVDLRDRCNTHVRDEINGETSVPYMIGALLCERIIRTEGKDALLKAMAASEDHWAVLRPFGITPRNLTDVIKEELEKPIAFAL